MNTVAQTARRLVQDSAGHRVISLYLDLDPARFSTAPARASQVNSLIDEAAKQVDQLELSHDDRVSLRDDIDRVRAYLLSGDPPFQGAHSLAVFCSGRAELFETVQLTRPVPGQVVIGADPYIEPMIAASMQREWCVVLVSRREGRVFMGPADALTERHDIQDDVHGQHEQGGWSQARYERSVEKEVDDHLRRVVELLGRRWRRDRFDRLALGGPVEAVTRLESLLGEELAARLAPERVEVDVSASSESDVIEAVAPIVEADERRVERDALQRMAEGIGSGGRGAGGPQDTVAALNEHRVQTLLIEPGFDAPAQRCPACGLLVLESDPRCPADGTELAPVEHLREAAVEAALTQDAEVIFVRHQPDLGPLRGIGAILRF